MAIVTPPNHSVNVNTNVLGGSTLREILLVEDNAQLASTILDQLSKEGYAARWAADGLEALAMFRRAEPDLILLDWMLPKLSGLDVLKQIRTISPVPVLMLTARTDETDRVVGLELGADDYVAKPFGMRELLARIRALFRRLEHVQQIVAGDRLGVFQTVEYQGRLRLEPDGYEAYLDSERLDLTRTEFDLLVLLASNPGRAFSRDYLIEVVWGETRVTGDRSVDNAMSRLRRKLGDLGEAIEAVWGVGYRLRREL